STEERQAFVADAVAKIRSAKAQGEAEYYAALGDYLVRESAFFWLLAGIDAGFRADAEGEPLAESVSSTDLDAALARAEKTADPNFRYLAELHRALADEAKRDRPDAYRDGCAEPLGERVRSPFWRAQLKPRPCRALDRELETGVCFLVEAAAQGNGDAAASLARYIENDSAVDLTPSGFVAEIGRRNGITEDDLKSKTPDERPAIVAKIAFLYALAGAEAGSPQAQGLVASYYARGFGVERNVAEALRWGERFYEADVASGPSNFYPGLWYAKHPGDLRPVVPKTLDELNAIEARLLRRLAPLGDTLSFCPPEFQTGNVAPGAPLARRLFLESCACDFGRAPSQNAGPKSRATFLLLAEAALDLEPTPETLALAEKFLRRANDCEELSIFYQTKTPDDRVIKLDADVYRGTPGFAEANDRLAEIFETGSFGVQDDAKAREFRRFAYIFEIDRKNGRPAGYILHLDPANDVPALASLSPSVAAPLAQEPEATPAADARHSFVAPQTPEFEAVIAPIFARLEKTLVDAKNGNAAALTARFNEYFDDATDLYPNGRPGSPEVARYKAERLTQEIERLEKSNADDATLERLRERRERWNRLASA
ncbi:MAG: sel1 repeat family protein, partial [Thermoguttaceae bacterium]|nr:sel1 repeat family protein [Thermoguttaceae bacterium]